MSLLHIVCVDERFLRYTLYVEVVYDIPLNISLRLRTKVTCS